MFNSRLFCNSPDPIGHVNYCHYFVSFVLIPDLLHFNILLWNHLVIPTNLGRNVNLLFLQSLYFCSDCKYKMAASPELGLTLTSPTKLQMSFISSPWPKVHVNYCHHLASVVCKLFTFQASPKPLGQLEPSLAGMFLGWFLFFVPVGYSTWLPGPIICSNWLKFQRSSSLKLMNWLNPNCKWMIIGMFFTKFLFFMPIGNPRWPPPQDID